MILTSLNDLSLLLKEPYAKYKRLLSLDLGTKTIGLAVSDGLRSIASPLKTLERQKFSKDVEELKKIIKEYEIIALIIGLPMNMNGSYGPRAQSAKDFGKALLKIYEIPILFWDERLSTVAVERTLLEADISRNKRKQVIDKMAASFILQGVLEGLRFL